MGVDGGEATLHEPVKTAGYGEDAVELRRLTPQEKAKRKRRKNVILFVFCGVILGVAVVILLIMGPL